jgi:hypothetical protein
MPDLLYRIARPEVFENAETRKLRHLSRLQVPIDFGSTGYKLIMLEPDGPAIYGAWIVIAAVGANCLPRWTLRRSDGRSHTPESISVVTSIGVEIVRRAWIFLASDAIGWLVSDSKQARKSPKVSRVVGTSRAGGGGDRTGGDRRGQEREEACANALTGGVDPPVLPRTARESPHRSVTAAYSDGFMRRHGKRPSIDARDGRAVKELLATVPVEDVLEAISRYLDQRVGWAAEHGWPLRGLQGDFNRLRTTGAPSTAEVADKSPSSTKSSDPDAMARLKAQFLPKKEGS